MPGKFDEALAQNPAPKRVGDVTLRYDTTLLVGEADRVERGLRFTAVILAGVAFALGSLGGVLAGASTAVIGGCAAAMAASFGLAAWLDQLARRQRRFVLNFATTSLRLDFSTPFANRPRTMVVHFDGVKDCALYEQADGRGVLTVDFVLTADSPQTLREVLVANIGLNETEGAQRLHRVLKGAFGLGEKPQPAPIDAGPD
jgi:hypothetical protein